MYASTSIQAGLLCNYTGLLMGEFWLLWGGVVFASENFAARLEPLGCRQQGRAFGVK
jgi:hypothetical protein